MKVNLFIPGMPKCGSFFLYDLLKQHPDICMSSVKEPAYFTKRGDVSEYESYFLEKDKKYYGEATVEYLIKKEALNHIKNEVENPKFIILLRHPVKRAISHYFHRMNGGVDKTTLFELLKSPKGYPIHYSNYSLHLESFFEIFDKKQALIIISEDLYKSPKVTYDRILNFLDLPEHDLKFNMANQNKGKASKSLKLSYYLKKMSKNSKLKSKLNKFLPFLKYTKQRIDKMNTVDKNQMDLVDSNLISTLENILKPDATYVKNLLNRQDIWKDL